MLRIIPLHISRILATSILMFILVGTLISFHAYDHKKALEYNEAQQIEQVRILEWEFLQATLFENYDKASVFSDGLQDSIEKRLTTEYASSEELKRDLDNPREDAKVYSIFSDEIRGKYLNDIKTDSNDPFIATPRGIASDLSLNCSLFGGPVRTWDVEIAQHYNQTLASKAVEAMVMQNSNPIFWEFLPPARADHYVIDKMDLNEVRTVFLREGLEGIKTYEFLKPVYIRDHEDIFGTPDVNNLGKKQTNYKIIVVAGFSLYEVVMVKHKSEITAFNDAERAIRTATTAAKAKDTMYEALVIIVLVFCIAGTAMVNNHVVRVMENAASEQGSNKTAPM